MADSSQHTAFDAATMSRKHRRWSVLAEPRMTAIPATLRDAFFQPPRAYSPVPIWWWSGEPLDPARLRWQLERFAEGGVYNLVVLNLAASGPLHGSDADDPSFFSARWWEILERVCDDARELGVSLWLYDQIGFSGAAIQARLVSARPNDTGQWLERSVALVDEGGELSCPGIGQPIAALAYPVDDSGTPAAPGRPVELDRDVARWPGPGPGRLVLFYTVARGFDYLSADACGRLLDAVHGEVERNLPDHLGSTIVGTFQDELPSMPTWSPSFAAEFARRNGYDLLPRLDELWEQAAADGGHVRRDYHATRAALAEAAFFAPLAAWHERHGLLVGCDQQDPARAGHPVGSVRQYGDYLRTHRWFSAPGSDHHGDARVHSSLAHLYGRPRTWIESFHSTGWGGTLEETFDWLLPWLRAGATLYNPHASYYSTRGGWWEWAPPSTDWRQPYWAHYKCFADAVTRLCASLSLGSHACDVGVLFPTATVQAGTLMAESSPDAERAHRTYLELVGDMTWFHVVPGTLDRLRRDFDVLDDDSVQRGKVDGGRLRIAGEAYAVVVLPACTAIDEATATRLRELVEGGGHVVAVGAPPSPGGGDETAALADCFARGEAAVAPSADELEAALAPVPARIEAPVPTLVRDVEDTTLVLLTTAMPRATDVRVTDPDARGTGQGWTDAQYGFDPARYARSARVRVHAANGPAMLLEPFSGRTRALSYAERDGCLEVDVPFDDGPAALLLLGAGDEPSPAPEPVLDAERDLGDVWDVEVVATMDNRWGDLARPAGPLSLERWEVRHRTESAGADGRRAGWAEPEHDDADWTAVSATFGPRARARSERNAGPWRDVVWSLSRGIRKDELHHETLGPKGHVPEEFLDLGEVEPGETMRVAFYVDAPAAVSTHLAVGAAAAKRAWLGGEEVQLDHGGYLAIAPVRLAAGSNRVELNLVADERTWLRAHVAFVADPDRYRRPEWIAPSEPPAQGSSIAFHRALTLAEAPTEAHLQVAATAPCRVLVNGQEVGRQGGFDPYYERGSAHVGRYDLVDHLGRGENDLVLETSDMGIPPTVLADAVIACAGEEIVVMSGADWDVRRDAIAVPVRMRRRQWRDPAWSHLWRRPHPLPGARWLEDGSDTTVLDLAPAAELGAPVEWLRFDVPPGATAMRLAVHGAATVFVDGHEAAHAEPVRADDTLQLTVDLAGTAGQLRRVCAVRVETRPAWRGGAILAAPVRFDTGRGVMRLGDWEDRGLRGYSGGVRYETSLPVDPAIAESARVVLDLGRVRGTAEVSVDGVPAGTRVCSPYRFDLTDLVHTGDNELEITVFNTLAPYLDATSPTRFVFPGQRVSGLFGPVRLRWSAPVGEGLPARSR